MKNTKLLDSLVYLDRDYVSSAYEAITGTPSSTQITKTEAKKAGAGIPVFSAEISAGETRSFQLSSVAMLDHLLESFSKYPEVGPNWGTRGKASKIAWFHGYMSVFMIKLSRDVSGEKTVVAAEKYFGIRRSDGLKLALLTTPEYFTSGFDSLIKVYDTVLGEHSFPVAGLVRVLPAKTDFKEVIAVPLVIYEEPINEDDPTP